MGGGGRNVAGALRGGGVGGGELQFERDAVGLLLAAAAHRICQPGLRGPGPGAAGHRRQRLLDRSTGMSTSSPIAEPSGFLLQFSPPVDGGLFVSRKLRSVETEELE